MTAWHRIDKRVSCRSLVLQPLIGIYVPYKLTCTPKQSIPPFDRFRAYSFNHFGNTVQVVCALVHLGLLKQSEKHCSIRPEHEVKILTLGLNHCATSEPSRPKASPGSTARCFICDQNCKKLASAALESACEPRPRQPSRALASRNMSCWSDLLNPAVESDFQVSIRGSGKASAECRSEVADQKMTPVSLNWKFWDSVPQLGAEAGPMRRHRK